MLLVFKVGPPNTDIFSNKSCTLPFSHRRNIAHLALNPRGNLLLSIDEDGRAILSSYRRRLALHHFSFKAPVSALAFSPSGHHFAVGIGRLIEVWHTPSTPDTNTEDGLEFAPFIRYRVYAGHHDIVQSLEWSSDSRFFLSSSKDLTARIWSLDPEDGFVPTTLSGHRECVLNAWFSNNQEEVIAHHMRFVGAVANMPPDIYNQPGRCIICVEVHTNDHLCRRGLPRLGRKKPIKLEDCRTALLHAKQR